MAAKLEASTASVASIKVRSGPLKRLSCSAQSSPMMPSARPRSEIRLTETSPLEMDSEKNALVLAKPFCWPNSFSFFPKLFILISLKSCGLSGHRVLSGQQLEFYNTSSSKCFNNSTNSKGNGCHLH